MIRSVGRSGLLLVALAVFGGACGRPDPALLPDAFLRDSLGLDDDDRVHRVRLGSTDNRERIEPVQLTVRPGDYVEFSTQDRFVHVVGFVLDELPVAAASFLRDSGQEGSPPLVEAGSRFLVSFTDAPPGTYDFVVIGNGEPGRGIIVVSPEG